MNRKKVISVVSLIVVLAAVASVLVACNYYKWDSVGAGDSGANVVSNGGYFVQQGGYVYFINGYVGDNAANDWGTPYKQSIMRAKIGADGTIDNSSAVVVVPKSIYNSSVNGGFAVFGDWIYYATPNNDEDKSGTPSTTHTDFMRTKTDGTVTQLIATINSRSSEFLFTPSRILYRTDTATVYYIDFSGMSTIKAVNNGKGATSGVLIENATSILWGYDADWSPSAGTVVSDYVFYTQSITGDESYKHYNTLCAVKYDGSDRRTLATFDSYFDEGDTYENSYQKIFTFSLADLYFESDDTVTLYYNKSIYEDSSSKSVGLYSNTFSLTSAFDVKAEKRIAASSITSFFPLGGDRGILVAKDNNTYILKDVTDNYDESDIVIGGERAATVQAVIGDYVYYTVSGGTALYRINLDKATGASPNEDKVIASGVKSDWLSLEFAGNRLYYFNTDDYSYVSYVDLNAYEGKELTATMIGKMTSEDAAAKEEAEKKENEE